MLPRSVLALESLFLPPPPHPHELALGRTPGNFPVHLRAQGGDMSLGGAGPGTPGGCSCPVPEVAQPLSVPVEGPQAHPPQAWSVSSSK